MPRHSSLPFTRQRAKGGTFTFKFQLPSDVVDALCSCSTDPPPRSVVFSLKTRDPVVAKPRALQAAAHVIRLVARVREQGGAVWQQPNARDFQSDGVCLARSELTSVDRTPAVTKAREPAARRRKLGEIGLMEAYKDIYLPRRRERHGEPPRRRSQLEWELSITRFINIMGDRPITAITRTDAETFARSLDMPSPATRKKCINALASICNAAIQQQVLNTNPFRGLGPTREAIVAARRSYRRFDRDGLIKLFARTEQESGAVLWVPRLLLFTGARLDEMAQLRSEWFGTRDGIPVIDLRDARLKDQHNRRSIPLHRTLLRLGILDFVARADERLFPELKYRHSAERWGAALSTRLNREIDAAMGSDRSFCVHSLRKTFEHAAYVAGIQKPTFNAITGHRPHDVSEEHYLHLKEDTALLKSQVDLLDFEYLF